jgi:hypothetical protein
MADVKLTPKQEIKIAMDKAFATAPTSTYFFVKAVVMALLEIADAMRSTS